MSTAHRGSSLRVVAWSTIFMLVSLCLPFHIPCSRYLKAISVFNFMQDVKHNIFLFFFKKTFQQLPFPMVAQHAQKANICREDFELRLCSSKTLLPICMALNKINPARDQALLDQRAVICRAMKIPAGS